MFIGIATAPQAKTANTENTETELTEEEKIKQTEQLFLKLRIMGANFNLNKNNSNDDSE